MRIETINNSKLKEKLTLDSLPVIRFYHLPSQFDHLSILVMSLTSRLNSQYVKVIDTTAGQTLIATQSIPPGTNLFTELPLISFSPPSFSVPYLEIEFNRYYHHPPEVLEEFIDHLNGISEEDQMLFYNLGTLQSDGLEVTNSSNTRDKIMRATGVLHTNEWKADNGRTIRIYPHYSVSIV